MAGGKLTERDAELLCREAGSVAAGSLAVPPGEPDVRQWAAIQLRLSRRGRVRRVGRQLVLLGAPAMVLGAMALWLVVRPRPAPLSYLVEGCSVAADGRVSAASEGGGAVRFSDGSVVTLAGGAQCRVDPGSSVRGTELVLEDGRAHLAVHHGRNTRWAAVAGPFRVEVTGTKFGVDWSRARRRFTVEVSEGQVIVKGATAGEGISLRAGERLVSSLDEGKMEIQRASGERNSAVQQNVPAAAAAAASPATKPSTPETAVQTVPAVPSISAERTSATTPTTPAERRVVRRAAVRRLAQMEPIEPLPSPVDARADEPPTLVELPPKVREPQDVAELELGAGGGRCPDAAQFGFEGTTMGFEAINWPSRALGNPAVDRTRSWCGTGSLRLDANFRTDGFRNRLRHLYAQSGDVSVRLASAVNLGGRTITAHVFVDAPSDARYGVSFYVVSHGRYCFTGARNMLPPGRWATIQYTFPAEMAHVEGGTVSLDSVWRIGLIVNAEGPNRTWTGAVYLDDVEIR